jgi:hypothetical protein
MLADIFNKKNAAAYLGVSHGNFTTWDDVKEPVGRIIDNVLFGQVTDRTAF